jgi:hypothetical protein
MKNEDQIPSKDLNQSSNSSQNAHTRRNFMKKSALSVGAVTFLSKGTAFASPDSYTATYECPSHNMSTWQNYTLNGRARQYKYCTNTGCNYQEQRDA